MCEICPKLTIKTAECGRRRHSDVSIVNFEKISHIALMFPLLHLN